MEIELDYHSGGSFSSFANRYTDFDANCSPRDHQLRIGDLTVGGLLLLAFDESKAGYPRPSVLEVGRKGKLLLRQSSMPRIERMQTAGVSVGLSPAYIYILRRIESERKSVLCLCPRMVRFDRFRWLTVGKRDQTLKLNVHVTPHHTPLFPTNHHPRIVSFVIF